MKRRQAFSLALGGLAGIPGCRESEKPDQESVVDEPAGTPVPEPSFLEGSDLTPARIEPTLEVRSTVGLRPFRRPGFVVRRDERGGKTVIHNYGHGGGGISLSWGSSNLAIELAGPLTGVSCAVVGSGVLGLSTARLLQLRGAKVTLYTRSLPLETTSNKSGAQWWPTSVFSWSRRTEAFQKQFIEAAHFSYRYFQKLVGLDWGVRLMPNYYLTQNAPRNDWMSGPGGALHDLQIGFQDFGPGEHIFPSNYVRRFQTMLIEPATYLNRLMSEVQGGGAEIEIRNFSNEEEVLSLPERLIFNCSGLGAKNLFGDEDLMPVRGQLSIMVPQAEVTYNLSSNDYYMFPRSDGIVLGGTYQKRRWDLAPNAEDRKRIIQAHQKIFSQMAENIHSFRRGEFGKKS
ncbi:FAD-dependent oxidoreductase [Verrucomicrobiaceae bacterium 227]